jgi:hypothetical protein
MAAASAAPAPIDAGPSVPLRDETFCPVVSGDLTLYPLAHDGLLMVGHFPYAVCDAAGRCDTPPDTLVADLDPMLGDYVSAAAGTWGHDMWLTSFRAHVEGSLGWTAHHDGRSWRNADRTVAGYRHVELLLSGSSDGTVVGVTTFEIDGVHATGAQAARQPPYLYGLETLSGPRARLPQTGGEPPVGLLALAHGQVVVIVEGADGRAALRSGHSSRIKLPSAPGCDAEYTNPLLLAGIDDGPVYVAGAQKCGDHEEPWLVRLDGATATALELPRGVDGLWGLAVTHDGTAWLGAGDAVAVRAPDGTWSRALLPPFDGQTCLAGQIVARTDADLFVHASCGKRSVVFRTSCPSPLLPPADAPGSDAQAPRRRPLGR